MAAPDYYLVRRSQGAAWDSTRGRREQAGWDEHADFMDGLAAEGFVVLGGPAGPDVDRGDALLLVSATDQDEVRARLVEDPWEGDMLVTRSVEPWHVWLRAPGAR
ncbi:MAG TPA: hypothetical protein VHK22_08005 [Gaiellaceae bacterium]|jgi:uncharacterized protein YciI|nr:hypothetical protein [Gaiellaceae bacterium]